MRQILRLDGVSQDQWQDWQPGHTEAHSDRTLAVIVPLVQWRADSAQWQHWLGPLGVRIGPETVLSECAADLSRWSLVAIEFPTPGEGRGYSLARLLRERYGFGGEIRAVGAVKRDQVFFMARCGFNAFELAQGEDHLAAHEALQRYSHSYQPHRGASTLRQVDIGH